MGRIMISFSPELSATLERILLKRTYPADKKKMFGHETFFLNGYMFTGATEDGIFVHVGRAERDILLEKHEGTTVFEPMEGMIMKDYLLLSLELSRDEQKLEAWLERSARYLLSLPPKVKAPKKKVIKSKK